uniref:Uncharacterized protein n=1 Tax=Arundo donax TaxID=35708 RepID=A0A0A9DFV0_ARUDO
MLTRFLLLKLPSFTPGDVSCLTNINVLGFYVLWFLQVWILNLDKTFCTFVLWFRKNFRFFFFFWSSPSITNILFSMLLKGPWTTR